MHCFLSKQSTEFQCDSRLVQWVFLDSLYQGCMKNIHTSDRISTTHLRHECYWRLLSKAITRSVTEGTERQNRLGQTHKQKSISVNAAQQDKQNSVQMQAEVKANCTAWAETTDFIPNQESQESSHTCSTWDVRKYLCHSTAYNAVSQTRSQRKIPAVCSTRKWQPHSLFWCGKDRLRFVSCLLKTNQGNQMRSLGRDHQWSQQVKNPRSL